MLGAVLLIGVVAGLDNLQVCSSLGLLPMARARKQLLALVFSACETLAPVAGLAAGRLLLISLGRAAVVVGPIAVLLCGLAVIVLALRKQDVCEVVASRGVLCGLPLSLSLDNLLAGVGLGSMHLPVVFSALTIGLTSAAMSCIGLYFGGWLRRFIPGRVEFAAGALLCALGVRMLLA
jgi:manganese efflux pump family protein